MLITAMQHIPLAAWLAVPLLELASQAARQLRRQES